VPSGKLASTRPTRSLVEDAGMDIVGWRGDNEKIPPVVDEVRKRPLHEDG
jgi:hypothetical protein